MSSSRSSKAGREIDWLRYLKPLFLKYGKQTHPLHFENDYQLMVVVVLSARTTDALINKVAPTLFRTYPSFKHLAAADPEDLFPYLSSVTNFARKAKALVEMAKQIGEDGNIPRTMEGLTSLRGIGRKSANVIMGEMRVPMEGVQVDLHVARVAPRLGIARGSNPEAIEKQLMEAVPRKHWRELGIGLTFLGREICRPTNPRCPECVMNPVCGYYKSRKKR